MADNVINDVIHEDLVISPSTAEQIPVNIVQEKDGNIITIRTYDRTGAPTEKTVTEPTATVSKSGHAATISVTDANGTTSAQILEPTVSVVENDGDYDLTINSSNGSQIVSQTVTIPNPNKELSDRAHIGSISRSKTRTGNPIQIEDAVNEIADKTVIKLVPKQDLHGYSRPWVGGAGKNKLSGIESGSYSSTGSKADNGTRLRCEDPISVTAGQSYTISAVKASGSGTLQVGFNVYSSIGTERIANISWQSLPYTFTIPTGGNFITCGFRLSDDSNISTSNVTNAQFELGSSVTSYEPYANLCPISGYDTVRVLAARKNLFDPNVASLETLQLLADGSAPRKGHSFDSGVYTIHNRASGMNYYRIVKKDLSDRGTTVNIGSGISVNNVNVDSDHMLWVFNQMNSTYETFDGLCVERGASQAYEEWEGQTSVIAVSLATNGNQTAGTVYSGTVTLLADGSGQVKTDAVKLTKNGSEVWATESSGSTKYFATNISALNTYTGTIEYCNMFASANIASTSTDVGIRLINSSAANSDRIAIRLENITSKTADDLIALLQATPLEVILKLSTPVTYTLTANQVHTLLGYNYIYTDGAEIALTYRQESLATNETLLKLLPTGSASGNPVTFSDGADSVPLKQLTVNVEPNQDLHGYSKPWVGGAGKNLLDPTNAAEIDGGVTWTMHDNGTIDAGANSMTSVRAYRINVTLDPGDYYFSGGIDSTHYVYVFDATTNARAVKWDGTTTGDAQYGANPAQVKIISGHTYRINSCVAANATGNVVFKPMICKSTETDFTFTPYKNICPIRGWDSVPLLRTGKNLYDWKANIYTQNKEIFLPEGNYVLSCKTYSGTHTWYISGLKLNGEWCTKEELGVDAFSKSSATYADIYYGLISVNGLPFSSPVGGAKFKFGIADTDGTVPTQIEIGSTATAYEDPIAKTYDISIPSEAGTVYGGTITLDENGEGTLTVTHGIVDLGSLTYTYDSQYPRFISTSNLPVTITTRTLKCICSAYRCIYSGQDISSIVNGDFYLSAQKVVIHDNSTTDASAFKTSVAGQMMVYPLATPITYSLTADQVKTLLGTNIISSDAGTVSVKYFKVLGEEQDLSGYAKKNNPVFTGTNFKFGGNTFSASDMDVLRILIDEWLDATGGYPVEPADPNSGGNGGIEEYAPVEPGTGGGSGGSEVAEEPAEP